MKQPSSKRITTDSILYGHSAKIYYSNTSSDWKPATFKGDQVVPFTLKPNGFYYFLDVDGFSGCSRWMIKNNSRLVQSIFTPVAHANLASQEASLSMSINNLAHFVVTEDSSEVILDSSGIDNDNKNHISPLTKEHHYIIETRFNIHPLALIEKYSRPGKWFHFQKRHPLRNIDYLVYCGQQTNEVLGATCSLDNGWPYTFNEQK